MPGLVAFNQMPGDIRVPLFYAEINAGTPPYSGDSATLLVGRKLGGGSATIGVPVNIGSANPNALFGAGSMLADMALFARWHNPTGLIYALPVTDPAGAAASGNISFTGPATAAGTFVRYIAGERYPIAVASGDSAATICSNFVAAVNKGYTKFNRPMSAPVVASIDGTHNYQADFTARHVGTEGNGIRIEAGLLGDEVEVPGVTATITGMSSGTGDVDMAAAMASIGAQQFDWIIAPYALTAQLNAMQTFLGGTGSGRWSPTVGLFGHYITVNDGNLSAQTTLGAARNDPHCSILGTNAYPHPRWSWAAALGGVVGFSKNLGRALTEAVEIARPLQTIVLQGLLKPLLASNQWALSDRDSLYRNGIGAVTFGADGQARIDRIVTSYLTNSWGQADITFLDIETIAISEYVTRYIKTLITSQYPRHVLRDDNPRGLQGVVTPDAVRAAIVHAYTELSEVAGIVENSQLFSKYLIVERSSDPNRLNAYLPIDVANQLRVFAANITVYLQLSDATANGL